MDPTLGSVHLLSGDTGVCPKKIKFILIKEILAEGVVKNIYVLKL